VIRRGAVVVVRQRGVYEGKPRPAIVIQAEPFLAHHPSVLVCLVADEEENAGGGAVERTRKAVGHHGRPRDPNPA
jgi:mRNA-degrading endonuclease toxin of MazEF toxin-antitoxin module